MAKKTKKEEPFFQIEDKKYPIEKMTDEQKLMINHIQDIQSKENTNRFVADQLAVGKEAFINMLKSSLNAKDHSPHDPVDENDNIINE